MVTKRGSIKKQVTMPAPVGKYASVTEKTAYLKRLRSAKAKLRKLEIEKRRSKELDKKIAQERRDFYKVRTSAKKK